MNDFENQENNHAGEHTMDNHENNYDGMTFADNHPSQADLDGMNHHDDDVQATFDAMDNEGSLTFEEALADFKAAEQEAEDETPKASFEERQAEWLEQARDVASVEDLEFYKLELDEAIETMKAKKAEYQNAVVKRTLVYGRASVSADLGVSRKSLANLENELKLDRPDVSEFYEELKKAQDREARRAERAAKKAAEEAAAVEALLSKISN